MRTRQTESIGCVFVYALFLLLFSVLSRAENEQVTGCELNALHAAPSTRRSVHVQNQIRFWACFFLLLRVFIFRSSLHFVLCFLRHLFGCGSLILNFFHVRQGLQCNAQCYFSTYYFIFFVDLCFDLSKSWFFSHSRKHEVFFSAENIR